MNLFKIALIVWLCVSVATFGLYGYDKYQARHGGWRVPEKTLLMAALLMGGPGALVGMNVFRHKTKHVSFKILVPLCCLVNAAVVYLAYRRG